MNSNIKIDKFELTESKPILKLSDELKAEFLRKSKLKIELIEVEEIANPSDLILVITVEGHGTTETPFYFYKHRTKFVFQNGRYILDTTNMDELLVQLGGTILDIRIVASKGIDKFKVTLFYRAFFQNEIVK
jgi:hypothetical protein